MNITIIITQRETEDRFQWNSNFSLHRDDRTRCLEYDILRV